MNGLKIAALYSLKPLELGYCGPQDKSATKHLLSYLSGKKVSERRVREILEGFEAAYPYYRLIAESNRIEDYFDERVVCAYWIGNGFLENVPTEALKDMIITDFSRPGLLPRELAEKKANEVPFGSKPHHSFHVLVLGSVTGRIVLQGKLLDLCRIGWAKVTKKAPLRNSVKVNYQPLVTEGNYQLGNPQEKDVNWNRDLIPELKIGQVVSLHWNQAVQILTQEDAENLQKYTQKTLDILNAAPYKVP